MAPTSTLSWIDYSSKEREDSMKALAMFQAQDSRDEMGIGAIRDSISDLMFPGVSTLQTRLKYFLFIAWIYKDLENRKAKPEYFAKLADRDERTLIETLKNSDDTKRIIGSRVGVGLKTLPSLIYWSGLRSWGIFELQKSREEYHAIINNVYTAKSCYEEVKLSRKDRDDWQDDRSILTRTWNEGLPPVPIGFPQKASFRLSLEEAEYIKDRIVLTQNNSLLAWLVINGCKTDIDHPIDHPLYNDFTNNHKAQVDHAFNFAVFMQGAAFLYNLMLAERIKRDDLIDLYTKELIGFEECIREGVDWDMEDFWNTCNYPLSPHSISPTTRSFVEEWYKVSTSNSFVANNQTARELIYKREAQLKRGRSRFSNLHMLDNWSGGSGTRFMDNRWDNVQNILNDLYDGLGGESEC